MDSAATANIANPAPPFVRRGALDEIRGYSLKSAIILTVKVTIPGIAAHKIDS